MSKILNGNRNGNGHSHGSQSLLSQVEKIAARAKIAALPNVIKASGVTFRTAEGVELRGTLSRVTRHEVIFELYNPHTTLRLSEVLTEFEIVFQEGTVYSGHAILRNLVNAGTKIICEATLKEENWMGLNLTSLPQSSGEAAKEFKLFLKEWQKIYKVLPEFKVAVADMQTFLHDLKLWLDRVQVSIRTAPDEGSLRLEKNIGMEIGRHTSATLTKMFEKFEDICRRVDPDILDAHGVLARRLLHPLLLCSPFLNRTYCKPLGYAGDYEMVNMILRDPLEGESLFAKIVNLWFWEQPPAEAHRNRIKYLIDVLDGITLRTMQKGNSASILSIGCGPAIEVQQFIAQKIYSDRAHFTLLDFNQDTLDYTQDILEKIKMHNSRATPLKFVRKSVDGILREGSRIAAHGKTQYDLVYCAGLFDYLTDTVCQYLMEVMYSSVSPGGMLVVTNVSDSNPRTPTMEHIMDWHLIYRSERDMWALSPALTKKNTRVHADSTGVNLFLEIRKPKNA